MKQYMNYSGALERNASPNIPSIQRRFNPIIFSDMIVHTMGVCFIIAVFVILEMPSGLITSFYDMNLYPFIEKLHSFPKVSKFSGDHTLLLTELDIDTKRNMVQLFIHNVFVVVIPLVLMSRKKVIRDHVKRSFRNLTPCSDNRVYDLGNIG